MYILKESCSMFSFLEKFHFSDRITTLTTDWIFWCGWKCLEALSLTVHRFASNQYRKWYEKSFKVAQHIDLMDGFLFAHQIVDFTITFRNKIISFLRKLLCYINLNSISCVSFDKIGFSVVVLTRNSSPILLRNIQNLAQVRQKEWAEKTTSQDNEIYAIHATISIYILQRCENDSVDESFRPCYRWYMNSQNILPIYLPEDIISIFSCLFWICHPNANI